MRRELPDLVFMRTDAGGMLIDPAKRSPDEVISRQPDDVPAQVSRVTKVPRLSSEQYRALFEALADLSADPPTLNRLGAEIREHTGSTGHGVPRVAANFVVQGLIYAGADPRAGQRDAWDFATRWRDNVLALCHRAGMELTDEDTAAIDEWLLGSMPEAGGG